MKNKFNVGDIVRYTAKFARTMGCVGLPINGKVVSIKTTGYFKGYPVVLWCDDIDSPEMVHPGNIESTEG